MNRRMSQRRALRRIERDLARSDPHLNALFIALTGLGRDKEMPVIGADQDWATLAARATGTTDPSLGR